MTRATTRLLAVAAGALCLLALLVVKTRLGSPEVHERRVNLLLALAKADAALGEELLLARHAQLLNYDPLVKRLRELEAGGARLAELPAALPEGSEARAQMAREVEGLTAVLARKQIAVERFKSENATLHNSLSFFPVAAFELAGRLDATDRALAAQVHALLRDVLMYDLHSNDEVLSRVRARLGDLSARERPAARAPWREDLHRVLSHGAMILGGKARLDAVTAEVLELPVRPALRRLQASDAEQASRMMSRADDVRLLFYLLAVVALAAAAYAFLKMQNASLALREANASLEERVRARTRDLEAATEALRASETQLALAQEVAHTGNWTFDLATGSTSWSAELYRLLGEGPRTPPSRALLLDHVHPEDRAAREAIDRALAEGTAFDLEHRLVASDGQRRTVHARAQVVAGAAGAPAKMIGTVQDVTQRRDLETKLAQAERMASLGTLVGGVGHEINNPLAYVRSNLGFLSSWLLEVEALVPPDWLAEGRKSLEETVEGADRIRRIVQDLHAFTRPVTDHKPVDVHRVVDAALNIAASELRFRANVVKDYGELPLVHADAARLGQVVLNLLVNAAHAIAEGRPADNEVRVATRTEGGCVLVEVSDTGCGIPADIQRHLFEPFLTTKPVGKGSGLGLSICHGIVTSLGGEIAVETEVGKGSTFRVSIPVERQPAPGAEALLAAAPSDRTRYSRAAWKVG
ncbi:MAG: DAHL domain-containing protein [Anaeromyxobacteraceae bacterium]